MYAVLIGQELAVKIWRTSNILKFAVCGSVYILRDLLPACKDLQVARMGCLLELL
jgi:hypothetical protein